MDLNALGAWLRLPAGQGEVLAVLGAATVLYAMFHYLGAWTFWLPRLADGDPERRQARAVHVQRGAGVLLLGLAPLALALGLDGDPESWGLGLTRPLDALVLAVGLLAVSLPAVLASSRKPANWQHYPLIRATVWAARLRWHNTLGWVAYLLAYEFFFRGFLLFALARAFGVWPAVAVTTLAYVFAHLPKFGGETAGTVPMGVLFALTALWTGGLWAPFAVHVVVALTSDSRVISANPALRRG